MRNFTRRCGLALALAVSFSMQAVAQAPTQIRMIGFGGATNLPAWVAQDKGFFAKEGLVVTLDKTAGSQEQMADVMNGKYEFVTTAFDNIVAYTDGQGALKFDNYDLTAILGVLPIAFGVLLDLTGLWTSCFMLLFALVATAGRDDRWLQTGGYAVLSLVWCGWILGALHGRWIPRLLALRPLVWVGTISYSLYLVHWPIVLMLKDRPLVVRVAVSVVVGVALHIVVERPARRALTARLTRQVVLFWLGAASAATVLAGVMNTAIG